MFVLFFLCLLFCIVFVYICCNLVVVRGMVVELLFVMFGNLGLGDLDDVDRDGVELWMDVLDLVLF